MLKKTTYCLLLVGVLLACTLLAFSATSPAIPAPTAPEDYFDFGSGWSLTINDTPHGEIDLPGATGAAPGDRIVLQKQLPQVDFPGAYLCIRSSQQFVRVFVGGEFVYSFGEPGHVQVGASPGSAWNFIPIDGRTGAVSIELTSPYPRNAGSVNGIAVGTRRSIYQNAITTSGFALVLSVTAIFAGFVLALFGLYLNKLIHSHALTYLGIFCILASTWSLMESKTLDLFFPYPLTLMSVSYLSLMFCPIPFFVFIKEFLRVSDRFSVSGYRGIVLLTCVNNIVCIVLQLTGVCDMAYSIASTHILIVLDVLILAVLIRKNWKQLGRGNNILFLVALAIFFLFSLLDIAAYQMLIIFDSTGRSIYGHFFRLGFIIFILLLAAVCIRQIFSAYLRGFETDMLEKMVNTDVLTGLYSRHAFERDLEEWLESGGLGIQFYMLMIDMNNLKQINDTRGHRWGDVAITAAANLMKEVFSAHGKCYRIGGDEFVMLLPSSSEEQVTSLIEDYHQRALRYSNTHDIAVSVAVGYDHYKPTDGKNLFALYSRVDTRMYQNKRQIKGERRKNWRPPFEPVQ